VSYALFPSIGEYPAYDDAVYDAFDVPDPRHRAYREAVAGAAPGRVVLDIGTGRDALWAVVAARAGARHVYAIEADPQAAERARQTIETAGLSDRVTLLAGRSTEQTLPVRADVCVSEIVGNIASAEGAIPALNDARARLCTRECHWIPFRMQTWAAAAAVPGDLTLAPESLPYLRRIFAGAPFDPRLCLAGPAAETLISDAAVLESSVFDHRRPAPGPEATGVVSLRVRVAGPMTGLLLWARVAVESSGHEVDGLTGETRGWAPVYVPVPEVTVREGEEIRVRFERRTGADGHHPDYVVTVGDAPPWHSPHRGGPFRASEFYRRLLPATI
jgi:type I protein arginine methyltransferase